MHKNMLIDPGDSSRIRVKKDVLWKPLLRGFRSYFRALLNDSILSIYQLLDTTADDLTISLEKQSRIFL